MSNNDREKLEKAANKMFPAREEIKESDKLPSLNLQREKQPKKIVRTFIAPKEIIAAIDKMAKKEGVPKNTIVVAILEKFFSGQFVEKSPTE